MDPRPPSVQALGAQNETTLEGLIDYAKARFGGNPDISAQSSEVAEFITSHGWIEAGGNLDDDFARIITHWYEQRR